jgi:hypothetical protein|tara:strand:+ start:1176 stop:1379 length:204 start_codon:yes stop_codon:yes gene_type:complete
MISLNIGDKLVIGVIIFFLQFSILTQLMSIPITLNEYLGYMGWCWIGGVSVLIIYSVLKIILSKRGA